MSAREHFKITKGVDMPDPSSASLIKAMEECEAVSDAAFSYKVVWILARAVQLDAATAHAKQAEGDNNAR